MTIYKGTKASVAIMYNGSMRYIKKGEFVKLEEEGFVKLKNGTYNLAEPYLERRETMKPTRNFDADMEMFGEPFAEFLSWITSTNTLVTRVSREVHNKSVYVTLFIHNKSSNLVSPSYMTAVANQNVSAYEPVDCGKVTYMAPGEQAEYIPPQYDNTAIDHQAMEICFEMEKLTEKCKDLFGLCLVSHHQEFTYGEEIRLTLELRAEGKVKKEKDKWFMAELENPVI